MLVWSHISELNLILSSLKNKQLINIVMTMKMEQVGDEEKKNHLESLIIVILAESCGCTASAEGIAPLSLLFACVTLELELYIRIVDLEQF